MSGKDVVVTPDDPLKITGQGPFSYNKVTIKGGQIYVRTNADVTMQDLIKDS